MTYSISTMKLDVYWTKINQLEKYLNLRNEAKSVVDIMIDAVYDKENSVYRRQK